jgi:hypothetical protein
MTSTLLAARPCPSGQNGEPRLFFVQHQLTPLPNHPLSSLSESRKQPGQHDLKPDTLLIKINRALGGVDLALRREISAGVSGPYFFFQQKSPAEFIFGAVEPDPYAALGLVLAEEIAHPHPPLIRCAISTMVLR